jgi:hypothetical protein
MHDCSLFWICTGTSIKVAGLNELKGISVKLVVVDLPWLFHAVSSVALYEIFIVEPVIS